MLLMTPPEFGHHYQSRMDALLEALSAALARADLAEERLAYAESQLIECLEAK